MRNELKDTHQNGTKEINKYEGWRGKAFPLPIVPC